MYFIQSSIKYFKKVVIIENTLCRHENQYKRASYWI